MRTIRPPRWNLEITNTGKRAGAEVVQLYVQDVKASVARPAKELKASRKLCCNPVKRRRFPFRWIAARLPFDESGAWVARRASSKSSSALPGGTSG